MYAKMAKDYINEARVQISSKEIKNISNPTYSYYISIEKFSDNDPLEPSPFGKWNEAYVIFVHGKNGQDRYYFASIDEVGWMINGVLLDLIIITLHVVKMLLYQLKQVVKK